MKMQFVFKYNVWTILSDGTIDHDDMQVRFVVAHNEEEADGKMDAYNEELKKNGFLQFHYVNKGVEIDGVII